MSLRLEEGDDRQDRGGSDLRPDTPGNGGQGDGNRALSYLENVQTTGQKLQSLAPAYISRALEKLSGTAKVHRFRRKAVIPKESLAFVAAAFRKAAEAAERSPS